MDPAERLDRPRMPEDPAQAAVGTVFHLAQPVPVLDRRLPSGDLPRPSAHAIVDADLSREHLAPPAVVVPGKHRHRHARVHEIGEGRQRAEVSARDHGAPLEPEIEQVAVDEQRAGAARELAQKAHEPPLELDVAGAEMGIGDDVTGRWQHGDILAFARALYKPRAAVELFSRTPPRATGAAFVPPRVSSVEFRVRYAETDQMGVAYHANYLIWCEIGRTDHIRGMGTSYREMEEQGITLAVSEAS